MKKGQVFFFSLMFGVIVLLFALAVAEPFRQVTDDARIELDCTNSSISDYDQINCLMIDVNLPMFIGFLIFSAVAVIGGILFVKGRKQ